MNNSRQNWESEIADGEWVKIYISCWSLYDNETPMVIPMFSRLASTMMILSVLRGVVGSQKLKMAVTKPELLIYSL
jgi:hypothetical protein